MGNLPCNLKLERLDDGQGLATTLSDHSAKWHKNCRYMYNQTKLKHLQNRKREDSSASTSSESLGTMTSEAAQEYFSKMKRHQIKLTYRSEDDDTSIMLAFSGNMIKQRKEWLSNGMMERKRRRELGLPEIYLYGKDCKSISCSDFVNKELILFSNANNIRTIPSLVDGMILGQRKVMFTCFERNDAKEIKVADLGGSIVEHSSYYYEHESLMRTIKNLAQNFVGSNNINLLQPIGQFGSRLFGGKDSASPRYISTLLSPLAQHIFNASDSPLLNNQYDGNRRIEPEYYVPIIPMVLVNGAEGVGTGWATSIPNYDPREIIRNLKRLLAGDEPIPMNPWYKNFEGTIESKGKQNYSCSGEVSVITANKIEITELPVKIWTQSYKEKVMEPMLHGVQSNKDKEKKKGTKAVKAPSSSITDYKEHHTDKTVKFVVTMPQDTLSKFKEQGMHRAFKLQTSISTRSMVLFDADGCIKKYKTVEKILKEFFTVRLEFYHKRKAYLDGMLSAEASKLDNQVRFILEKISGKVAVGNEENKESIRILEELGYDSDPVNVWKKAFFKEQHVRQDRVTPRVTLTGLPLVLGVEGHREKNQLLVIFTFIHMQLEKEKSAESGDEEEKTEGPDYDYLLNLSRRPLTEQKNDELIKKRDLKVAERDLMRGKTAANLWNEDLDLLCVELDAKEEKEKEENKGKKEDKSQKKLDDVFKAMEQGEGQSLANRLGDTPDKIEKKKKSPVKKIKPTMDTSDESGDNFIIEEIRVQPKAERPKRAKAAKTLKRDSSGDEWGSDQSEPEAEPIVPSTDFSDQSDEEKVDEGALVTKQELNSVLASIERIINSRPLTKPSDDQMDQNPITPLGLLGQHFNPEYKGIEMNSNEMTKRYRYIIRVTKMVQRRWQRDYLSTFNIRAQSSLFIKSLFKNGDLVYLDNRGPRQTWPLGRISQLIPGPNGIVRLLKVLCKSNELIRSIQRVLPLELDFELTPKTSDPSASISSQGDIKVITRSGSPSETT
ncbi:DNA topoisomerase 2-beta [Nymphon striatum]|nr:DNA topoisomerase 2-beta [Nymphon striatum]